MDPILYGPPTRKPRTSGALAIVAVLVLTIGIWLVSGGDPGTSARSEGFADTDVAASSAATATDASVGTDPSSGLPLVPLGSLPVEASQVASLIDRGGPFTHDEDGGTFFNYEGLLPDTGDGYYREYTVDTPGSADRGARRLVAGEDGELYWTEDHYASFVVVQR